MKKAPDDLVQIVVDAGGSAYRNGLLMLHIAAAPNSTVVVEGIEVIVHSRDPRPLAWAIAPNHQCGGGDADTRTYSLKLDAPNPEFYSALGEWREAT